jgi:hypothetical protein
LRTDRSTAVPGTAKTSVGVARNAARRDAPAGQRIDGGGDPDVRRPVGVDVVAEDESTRRLQRLDPAGDRREVVHEVAAGTRGDRLGAGPHGHRHRPGQAPRVADEPVPQVLAGQVDGNDVGAPAQQRPQRTHLGGGAEHDDGVVAEVEPLRVVDDESHGLGARRLDGPGGHPRVEPAAEGVAREVVAPVRHDERPVGLPLAAQGLGAEHVRLGGGEGVAQGHVALGSGPAHPVVERGEAVSSDRDRGFRRAESGLDEAPEVREVALPPARLPLGGRCADGVDHAERIGDDRAPDRRRAAPTRRGVGRKDHAGGVAHGFILPRQHLRGGDAGAWLESPHRAGTTR